MIFAGRSQVDTGEALVTFVWLIIWRIANNVGGSERPRLVG
jgi:hypothetical protein